MKIYEKYHINTNYKSELQKVFLFKIDKIKKFRE